MPRWLSLNLGQRRFGRACQHLTRGFESRPVARTIPCPLAVVPRHFATQVRARRRPQDGLSRVVAIRRDSRAVQFEDLPLTSLQRPQAATLGTREPIANEVIGIILVLSDVIPDAVADLRAAGVE